MHTHRSSPPSLSLCPFLVKGCWMYRSLWLDGGPEIWKVYYVRSLRRSTWLPAALALGFHTPSIWCLAVLFLLTSPHAESRHSATICLTLQEPSHLRKGRKGKRKHNWAREKNNNLPTVCTNLLCCQMSCYPR